MIEIERWVWKLNMPEMVCLNEENGVVVKIEKKGDSIKGRIKDLSMDLLKKFSEIRNGPLVMKQIVMAAENEFQKAGSECCN